MCLVCLFLPILCFFTPTTPADIRCISRTPPPTLLTHTHTANVRLGYRQPRFRPPRRHFRARHLQMAYPLPALLLQNTKTRTTNITQGTRQHKRKTYTNCMRENEMDVGHCNFSASECMREGKTEMKRIGK